ncbi:MAG TPA: LON peptidase substrate-binding domain-containing protein, partial [Stellaceae bacterium]|nr:LON peptidase substrate-binding domain-containing protein [Stellaceae bacterium]
MASPERPANQSEAPPLPADAIVIIPVRGTVLFPGTVLPITVGRPRSIAGAQEAVRRELPVGLVLQRDPQIEDPGTADLYPIGTTALVLRYLTAPDGSHHMVCQGQHRFRVLEFLPGYPYLVARIERVGESEVRNSELEARLLHLKNLSREALELLPQAPAELAAALRSIESIPTLVDMIASFLDLKPIEKQEVLATFALRERLDLVLEFLRQRVEVLRISHEIEERTKAAFDERQKEAVLRERMRQIRKELGEDEEGGGDIAELRTALAEAGMPSEVEEHVRGQIARLERMGEGSAEHSMTRSWLEWILAVPWSKLDHEEIDIDRARRILDEDHFGLEPIKRRIIEFLAVRKLNPEGH